MRIALYGNYLFNLAVGLRENPDNDVQIFLDSSTLWSCLSEEPLLNDSTFVQLAPWVTHREILRPGSARITEMLADFDVALVTDLGSIFAASSGTDFIYLPAGSELTEWPFPIRSRSTRPRGRRDVLAAIIAFRLRRALRASLGVWGHGPYPPLFLAASRLGLVLDGFLPPAINAEMFAPGNESPVKTSGSEALTIFHPNRITFGTHPHLVEVGGSFGNDRLFRGFAKAVREGVDARLRLIEREGSPDEEAAKELLETLGVSHRVEWLNSGTSAGFTWPEMAGLYRECDIVGSEL